MEASSHIDREIVDERAISIGAGCMPSNEDFEIDFD